MEFISGVSGMTLYPFLSSIRHPDNKDEAYAVFLEIYVTKIQMAGLAQCFAFLWYMLGSVRVNNIPDLSLLGKGSTRILA